MATKTRAKSKPGIQAKAKAGSSIKEKPRINESVQVVNKISPPRVASKSEERRLSKSSAHAAVRLYEGAWSRP